MMDKILGDWYQFLLSEDQLETQINYLHQLPTTPVKTRLKIKDDLVFSGSPFVSGLFKYYLGDKYQWSFLDELEGTKLNKGTEIIFPFSMAFNEVVSLERLALNLWQRSSAISTLTQRVVDLAKPFGIEILDTRKTTPGLRALEKYAVVLGGGKNHRYSQTDCWMIKDNHKEAMGGLKNAWNFFQKQGAFYRPTIVEIHGLDELHEGITLGVKHFLLDNFTSEQLAQAVELKPAGSTYEISGGVNEQNLAQFLIKGIDAISMGALTHSVKSVDISLKFGAV